MTDHFLHQKYIYWKYKGRWCIAKVQMSPVADKVYLYIWQLDGTYVGMTAGKRPETVLQSQGYQMWVEEGCPNLKSLLDQRIKNKQEQVELF
ncbi:hypothetical protein [Desulforamulus hydrothermalis]|uniref:Uncharacterized protein n=1 Tax=Desulforamulus hydrothermalis Lam5 = DSM 18033 TaxID=1121428 RepID=K8DXN8_9FIRM|nr:hypothetical protein [Desulforamulus hydrothermalis]CCO07364.1 conserved hypothetical protein [Desulforamulus hydrothermalis Lam5 = DSM 18033]SHG94952.1 hypothetical protein SAMN02745177_00908 [Desulforamulus hydrothermalis Lam5 = DSM 18033]